jgi:hypothetical protein
MMAPPALSVGSVAGLLRGYGGDLPRLFALGVGYPFAAEHKALRRFQTPTSHELPRTLAAPGALGRAFAPPAPAFSLKPRGARLAPLEHRESWSPHAVPARAPTGGGAR